MERPWPGTPGYIVPRHHRSFYFACAATTCSRNLVVVLGVRKLSGYVLRRN